MTGQIHFYNPPPNTTEQEQINLAFREAEEKYGNDKGIAVFISGGEEDDRVPNEATQKLVERIMKIE